jgi:NifB/MoaA-like Fe-S oxidoreductase
LAALLDNGIEVHGQLVVCPGMNDGAVLDGTFCGILDQYPDLASVAVVPLGVSRFNPEPDMRPHTQREAAAVIEMVADWQQVFERCLGRPLVHAADEYYLLADRPFPDFERYGDFEMHEDGIGMARAFEAEFAGRRTTAIGTDSGFFASVDGSPAAGYRSPRVGPSRGGCAIEAGLFDDDRALLDDPTGLVPGGDTSAEDDRPAAVEVSLTPRRDAPVAVLTGRYGAMVLGPMLAGLGRDDVRVVEIENEFFGGNIGVAGLMVGADLARVLSTAPAGHRYLLPDVCLSGGRFLDGITPADLPRAVEVVATDGVSLRSAIDGRRCR